MTNNTREAAVIQNLFRLMFIFLIIMSIVLSLAPPIAKTSLSMNDKIVHAAAYFSLMLACDFSWRSGKSLITKALLVFVYSGLIEYAQDLVPGRHMSSYDLAANAAGIGVFLMLVPVFNKLQLYRVLRLN